MKNLFVVFMLLAMLLPMSGCATFGGGNWQNNVGQLKADVFMFAKLATRITLAEADMSPGDVDLVKAYLVGIKDLLSVPGHPNFTGARNIISIKLPPKYHVYGFTIIDVLERYLLTANLDINEDQELILSIISSGLNGAIEAVEEFGV